MIKIFSENKRHSKNIIILKICESIYSPTRSKGDIFYTSPFPLVTKSHHIIMEGVILWGYSLIMLSHIYILLVEYESRKLSNLIFFKIHHSDIPDTLHPHFLTKISYFIDVSLQQIHLIPYQDILEIFWKTFLLHQ